MGEKCIVQSSLASSRELELNKKKGSRELDLSDTPYQYSFV